jgi:hypothetical protein
VSSYDEAKFRQVWQENRRPTRGLALAKAPPAARLVSESSLTQPASHSGISRKMTPAKYSEKCRAAGLLMHVAP